MTDDQSAQQIWAPWRMDFIRAPKEEGCFLCRIIRDGPEKDAENLVIYRGETCLLLMNRYPYNGGHLLVAPYEHVGTVRGLSSDVLKEMMELARLAERLLDQVASPQGYNLGINQGAAAGAGLKDHLHLHIVPRWQGDTNFMPVLGSTRVMPQALEEMHTLLLAALDQEEL